jgi:DNA-binding response OmpR family regulator
MKEKILLVEDNSEIVGIVKTELEFLGYDFIVAENGNKTVDMAASSIRT